MNSIYNVHIRRKYYLSVETYTHQDIREKLSVIVNCAPASTSKKRLVNTALVVRLTTQKRDHYSFYDVISVSNYTISCCSVSGE